MVSTKLKTQLAIEKTKRAKNVLLPIFRRENVSDFTNEILREDEELRNRVMMNPAYRSLLEDYVAKTFKDYKGVITGSKVVDSWDRITSTIGGLANVANFVVPGSGELISQIEDIVEEIPKALYAIYYVKKTGDKKAIPYWLSYEAASHIPVVGDAIDFTNIYVNRARKMTKEKVKKEMRKILPSLLEKKIT